MNRKLGLRVSAKRDAQRPAFYFSAETKDLNIAEIDPVYQRSS
jgi:hypothetical protein